MVSPILELSNINKSFGHVHANKDINLTINKGTIHGIIGENGAGKSTFIKLLTGQLSPSLGYAKVLGTNVAQDPQKIKANVGIVPESESPPSYLTSAEYLDFVCRIRGIGDIDSKVDYWLDWFGIEEKRDSLCKDLSKGQRQKVMLAGAFIHEPRLLFLDEPFVNLDPIYQRKCRELLMEHIGEGGTIFLCSHILEVAERMCTRVAVIDQGRVLAAGTLDELREDPDEDLEDIFIRLVGASVAEIESRSGIDEEE